MIVRTQQELDDALANPRVSVIEIRSPKGLWLRVKGQRPGVRVVAWESSSVVARGSSSVVARESSSVVAWESSSVEAWESSSVVARESSSVVARESSSVVARESSSVVARGSSSVVAWESSSVVAWESSSVEAWESSSVVATPHVAIHLHSARATVEGGVVIDVTEVDKTAANWIEHHGLEVSDAGLVTVYKAVDDNWTTTRGFDYSPGSKPTAPDWEDDDSCGGGLHFSPCPSMARDYFREAARFVAVAVMANELRPISGSTPKCKARSAEVLFEVDIRGQRIEATA